MWTLIGIVVSVLLFIVAWFAGYSIGVRDTEERWSEAVGRAEDRRRGGVA